MPYEVQDLEGCPIKLWLPEGHLIEEEARQQLGRVSRLAFVKRLCAMPDVHCGMGATIGSVIATQGAVIPAAVGVDIGCGMRYDRLSVYLDEVPQGSGATPYQEIFEALSRAIPHGRTNDGQKGDRGAWGTPPKLVSEIWRRRLSEGFDQIVARHPRLLHPFAVEQLGTLGTGNHFIEMTADEKGRVGIMIHSGSRGPGARIGTYFTRRAKQAVERLRKDRGRILGLIAGKRIPAESPVPEYYPLEDRALAYLLEGTEDFRDYVLAALWAQDYARQNRQLMMAQAVMALDDLADVGLFPRFKSGSLSIECHHNYLAQETHDGEDFWVTRKGAIRAEDKDWGIIPGSMGARSFLVQGKGNPESLNSCSHGAGRLMSRTAARQTLSVEDLVKDTEGVACYKDEGVLDEAPKCYKDIDAVMAAQTDLVEIRHTLKQFVCVKGKEKSERRRKKKHADQD